MDKIAYMLLGGVIIIILALAGNNFYQTPASTSPAASEMKPTQPMLAVININGFDCPTCPTIAENALKDAKGTLDAKTTSTGEGSRVLYDATVTTIEEISKVLPSQNSITVISQQPSQSSKLE